MTTLDTSRHADLIDVDSLATTKIAVVGIGAIGSNLVHLLISMGAQDITVYDGDTLEDVNVSPAFYSVEHIGQTKVEALRLDCLQRFGIEIKTVHGYIDETTFVDDDYDVVVIGPDTMEARRLFWIVFQGKWRLWIDAAMGGVRGMIFSVVRGQDTESYEASLRRSNNALQCGEKAFPPIAKGYLPMVISLSIWRWLKALTPIDSEFDSDVGIVRIWTSADPVKGYGTLAYLTSGQIVSSDSIRD